jgi:hypothetical protein
VPAAEKFAQRFRAGLGPSILVAPPVLSHWLTLYSDSLVHDHVSPMDARRQAGIRPAIYISCIPKLLRVDSALSVNPDRDTSRSVAGRVCLHCQADTAGLFRHATVAKNLVPAGTTQDLFNVHVVKLLHTDLELSADLQ